MANEDIPWFRALYYEILAYKRPTLFHGVLMRFTSAGHSLICSSSPSRLLANNRRSASW